MSEKKGLIKCEMSIIYDFIFPDSETSDMTESTDMSETDNSTSGLLMAASESPGLLAFSQVKQNPL